MKAVVVPHPFYCEWNYEYTQKSKLQQKPHMHYISEPTFDTLIADMGLLLHILTPMVEDREKSDGAKYTWMYYADKLC